MQDRRKESSKPRLRITTQNRMKTHGLKAYLLTDAKGSKEVNLVSDGETRKRAVEQIGVEEKMGITDEEKEGSFSFSFFSLDTVCRREGKKR